MREVMKEGSFRVTAGLIGTPDQYDTNAQGVLIAKRLAFGTYQVAVTREGFAPFVGTVEVRSVVTTEFRVTLRISFVLE